MATEAATDEAISDDTAALAWDERGLLPAVVQDARTGVLLMLAWMNAEALERTRTTGRVHFYSRSRRSLWMKGETSGNVLRVRELRADCDSDAILVLAEPAGPTCHTGRTSCFFRVMDAPGDGPEDADGHGTVTVDNGPAGPPVAVLPCLEAVLRARRDQPPGADGGHKSYTRSLLDGGFAKILGKIAEEHQELADELPAGAREDVVHETADLLFHVMVGLVARDIPLDEVWHELARRFGIGGHVEKAARARRDG